MLMFVAQLCPASCVCGSTAVMYQPLLSGMTADEQQATTSQGQRELHTKQIFKQQAARESTSSWHQPLEQGDSFARRFCSGGKYLAMTAAVQSKSAPQEQHLKWAHHFALLLANMVAACMLVGVK